MNYACRTTREGMELYLDGALSDVENEALGEHLLVCAACREWTEKDGALVSAVRQLNPRSVPHVSLARFRVAMTFAASAALLLVGVFVGRAWRVENETKASVSSAQGDAIVVMGSLSETLRPTVYATSDAKVFREDGGPVKLLEGEVQIVSRDGPVEVLSPHGELSVNGSARFLAVSDSPDGSYLEVRVHEGTVALLENQAGHASVRAGEAAFFQDGRLLELDDGGFSGALAMVKDPAENESESDVTQQRMRRLEEEIQRLKVLLAVAEAPHSADLDPLQVFGIMARRLTERTNDPEGMRRIAQTQARVFTHLIPGGEDAVVACLENVLSSSDDPARALLAVEMLGLLKGNRGTDRLRPFFTHESAIVRAAAFESVARRAPDGGASEVAARQAFLADPDVTVRLAAAGVLLRRGRAEEVLPRLFEQYVDEASPARRAKIIGRVTRVPYAPLRVFLLAVVRHPTPTPFVSRMIGQLLIRRGDEQSLALLEELAASATDRAVGRHLRSMRERFLRRP